MNKKIFNKIGILTLCILLVYFLGIKVYSYYYINETEYSFETTLLDGLNIEFELSGNNGGYTIESTFKSRDNYILTPSISNDKNVVLNVSGINKAGIVGLKVKDSDGEIKDYFFNVKPDILLNKTIGDSFPLDIQLLDFKDGGADFTITDGEDNYNELKDTLGFIDSSIIAGDILISYDTKYIFGITGNKIVKYLKNFEKINEYSIEGLTLAEIATVNNIKSMNNKIYLRLDNGSIYEGVKNSASYIFTDTALTYNNLGIINSSLVGTTDINHLSGNILDYYQVGNLLYVLTDGFFTTYLIKNGNVNSLDKVYETINSENLTKFIVLENIIYLFKNNGNIFIINNDFQIYTLIDTISGDSVYQSISKNAEGIDIDMYKDGVNLGISTSITNKGIEDILGNTKYGDKDGKPLYNNKNFNFKIYNTDFEELSITKSLQIKKYSNHFGETLGGIKEYNFKVPLVGYGIDVSKSSIYTNPKLSVGLSSVFSKNYALTDGEYYLHIKGYDYGLNESSKTTTALTKGPFLVNNSSPTFGIPSISDNSIDINTDNNIEFVISVDKDLTDLDIKIEDSYGNTSAYNLSNTSFVSHSSGFDYILDYTILSNTTQLKFSISGTDNGNNEGNLYYEYNFQNGWFQVLGITNTNVGIDESISSDQREKGFLFGVESKTEISSGINTDWTFNKEKANFVKIPTLDNLKIDEIALKTLFSDFSGRAKKEIDINRFYLNGNLSEPINKQSFLNGYYYLFDGNLDLEKISFEGNSTLLINGDLNIKGNILKNLYNQTADYSSVLKIYVTGDIVISSNVDKIDSFLFSNKQLTTLSSN